MPFFRALHAVCLTVTELALAWTPYSSLTQASEPQDYEHVLSRMKFEIKFHCETFLAMLFFMATSMEHSPLISWTLACLLYSLITYSTLEAMSGKSLHEHLDGIIAGRIFLAVLAKFPALSVIATLCALAITSWDSAFTLAVLALLVVVILLTLAIRLRAYTFFVHMWRWAALLLASRKSHTAASDAVAGVIPPSMERPVEDV